MLGCDVQSVYNAGDVSQTCQHDADEQIGAAAPLEEDTQRGQDDGEEDLDDIAARSAVSALRFGLGTRMQICMRGEERMRLTHCLPSGERHGEL